MRRKVFIVMLCLIIACVVWFVIDQLTYNPTCDGIDVSHYNKITTNGTVQDSYSIIKDTQFLITKATEGVTFKDDKFDAHKQYAKEHNLKLGAYHFLTRETSPKEQFENFKNVVGNDIDIVPCLDIEKYNDKNWTRAQAREYVKMWSDLCYEYYGAYPIIYCTEFYKIAFFHDSPNLFWINNWYFKPIVNCAIHQYSNNGETLDYNHLNVSLNELLLPNIQD